MKHIRQIILQRKALLLKIAIPIVSLAITIISLGMVFSLPYLPFSSADQLPTLTEDHRANIMVDLFVAGLSHPTSMAFIDDATILALEKDTGSIRKITDGILEKEPVLQLNVDSTAERGLLGIAVLREEMRESRDGTSTILESEYESSRALLTLDTTPSSSSSISSNCNCSIFVYFTQRSEGTKTMRIEINSLILNHNNNISSNNNGSLRNVIYKYDWDEKSLTNPELLLDLHAEPGPYHNGGKMKIGPDDQLYAVIGDLTSPNSILQNNHKQIASNNTNDDDNQTPLLINSSSVVLRINPYDGLPSTDNPFMKNYSKNYTVMGVGKRGLGMDSYYAYGIRNSFGLAFDPLTGRLWDTENGEDEYDEINIVNPGFNSGWHKIMGPISRNANFSDAELAMFKGAHYSDPIFSWKNSIGVTDIEFFNSSDLGTEYTNNLFVGDINNGNLYFFKVNDDRNGLNFENVPDIANDLTADNEEEVDEIVLGKGFGGITDIETGPDGNLYILSYQDGRIYRLVDLDKR
ncbi:MAG: PQQ-dependent sugar dehydrogenase [Nitrososphaeraceae archaeon]